VKTCTRCGGNVYTAHDPECRHDFGDAVASQVREVEAEIDAHLAGLNPEHYPKRLAESYRDAAGIAFENDDRDLGTAILTAGECRLRPAVDTPWFAAVRGLWTNGDYLENWTTRTPFVPTNRPRVVIGADEGIGESFTVYNLFAPQAMFTKAERGEIVSRAMAKADRQILGECIAVDDDSGTVEVRINAGPYTFDEIKACEAEVARASSQVWADLNAQIEKQMVRAILGSSIPFITEDDLPDRVEKTRAALDKLGRRGWSAVFTEDVDVEALPDGRFIATRSNPQHTRAAGHPIGETLRILETHPTDADRGAVFQVTRRSRALHHGWAYDGVRCGPQDPGGFVITGVHHDHVTTV